MPNWQALVILDHDLVPAPAQVRQPTRGDAARLYARRTLGTLGEAVVGGQYGSGGCGVQFTA